jgi:hypothetical protein
MEPDDNHMPPRDGLIYMIDQMILTIYDLPDHAKYAPVTHMDFANALVIISQILKHDR